MDVPKLIPLARLGNDDWSVVEKTLTLEMPLMLDDQSHDSNTKR